MTTIARDNGSRRSNSFVGKSLSYLVLLGFALFALYPISQIITIALRPSDQLLSTSLALIPKGATLANFRVLLTETPFLRWLGNSTLIAPAVTFTGVALASTCGYALSRSRFLGRSTMLNLVTLSCTSAPLTDSLCAWSYCRECDRFGRQTFA